MATFVDMFAGAGGFSEGFLQAETHGKHFEFLLSVIGEFSPEPIFDHLINSFFVYSTRGSLVTATRRHPVVSFFVSHEKYRGTVLEVNEHKYFVKEIDSISVARWPQDENLLAVTVRLDEGDIIQDDNYYTLRLDIPGENVSKAFRLEFKGRDMRKAKEPF